jgi:hypothetical protein
VRGEGVRVLEVYRAARAADIPAGGWLAAAGALDAYVALGGPADAPIERLSWERCRLRSVLARAGAVGVAGLFEVAPGSFEALRECRLSEGSSPQQLKVSRVLRSPAHEELLLARVVNLEPRR